jgi:uncharacterized protein (DUF2252 family)
MAKTGTVAPRAPREELRRYGQRLRDACPRQSHAYWRRPPDRRDPVDLLRQSSKGRIPELVPVRYGRMVRSPLAFYRGAALNMAADLASTPATGVRVQACGDCHLANFGAFGTPERRVIVDINDLDETLPAPWEWDVKRLAASFVLACRNNGHNRHDTRDAALTCVRSYRERMAELAKLRVMDVWYADTDLEQLIPTVADAESRLRVQRRLKKARARSVLVDDFPRLATTTKGVPSIKEAPPLIFHPLARRRDADATTIQRAFASYSRTLPVHRRRLLERFQLIDIAVKVVGVGSVGTRCFIMLLMAGKDDPLFLQVKEARPSVLAPYAGKSLYANEGQRIVIGHHLMQAASDVFLGWTSGPRGRQFYVRQLKDMKIKPLVELFTPSVMIQYAELCGRILARAHARSSEPAMISGYLGRSHTFDDAIADFALAYADESERDYDALVRAVRRGTLEAILDA